MDFLIMYMKGTYQVEAAPRKARWRSGALDHCQSNFSH